MRAISDPLTVEQADLAVTIYAYATTLEGATSQHMRYVIDANDTGLDPLNAMSTLVIEPFLARQAAMAYLGRFKDVAHPFALARIAGKNQCAGLVAYASHLVASLDRGALDEGTRVLDSLLRCMQAS